MSRAMANVDDLRRLQGSIRKSEEQIDQAITQLKRDLARAEWKDDKRQQFESKLNEAASSVTRAKGQIGELQPILTAAINNLNAYLKS